MGYCIYQHESSFFIPADKVAEAVKALKAMPEKHYSWVNDFQSLKTLAEIMREWRYPVEFDDHGNVTAIFFEGEKIGDEVQLFETLAPFVKAGSFIEMSGEDGARWRWEFDGKTMNENEARVVWDNEIREVAGRQYIVVCGENGEHHYEDESNLGEPVEVPGMDPNCFNPGTVIRIEDCNE